MELWTEAPRRRSTSAGSLDECLETPDESLSKQTKRNIVRRQRRRLTRTEASAPVAVDEADLAKALKRAEKALRAIEALEARPAAELGAEQLGKVLRKAEVAAAHAYASEQLEALRQRRAFADSLLDALDAVDFPEAYECGICLEVLELPVKVPCGHDFCRECIESVVKRATCANGVACPLCRKNFYDGVKKEAVLKPSKEARHKMKKVHGACHCGSSVPLDQLREHLRRCGAAAGCYAPRAALGHTFAKPDFVKAANEKALEKERLSDIALAPAAPGGAAAPPVVADMLEDALLRRYRLATPVKGPPRRQPSSDIADAPGCDAPPDAPPAATVDPRTAAAPPPAAAVPLDAPDAQQTGVWGAKPKAKPGKASLRDIIASEPSTPQKTLGRCASWSPADQRASDSPTELLLSAFVGKAPAPGASPPPRAPWASPQPVAASMRSIATDEAALKLRRATSTPDARASPAQQRPPPPRPCAPTPQLAAAKSLRDIALEEEAVRQLHSERVASPWAGAVARTLARV
ncbi:hypothetical protein M885DRAFT_523872 [Pelagophyceae sp. CCMP2097]|nr:hypothetical protein M885DRAFT_523872 [Pelagophyceae sp. CCMP2097]